MVEGFNDAICAGSDSMVVTSYYNQPLFILLGTYRTLPFETAYMRHFDLNETQE